MKQRRMYSEIEKVKNITNYSATSEIAMYVLATQKNIPVAEILKKEKRESELKEFQEIMANFSSQINVAFGKNVTKNNLEKSENDHVLNKKTKIQKKSPERNIVVNIGTHTQIDHPILPKQMLNEAQKMADIYPIFYIFENSVRGLIQHVMVSKYDKDWWDKATIPIKVKQKVEIRINDEDKNRWHGKRGAHPIFYTDIEELTSIIENNWKEFVSLLPQQHWVKTMIEIIGTSRNVVAHNNPLSPDDISALKVHFKQWTNQIKKINVG